MGASVRRSSFCARAAFCAGRASGFSPDVLRSTSAGVDGSACSGRSDEWTGHTSLLFIASRAFAAI